MIRNPQARRRIAVAAAAFTAFAVLAQERPSDGVYKDRIDWGVMMDMSGPASASQLVWTQGFQSYMRKVNEAGGINGRKINVLAEDDRFDAQQARVNLDKLSSQTPVLGISGMGMSSFQVASIAQSMIGEGVNVRIRHTKPNQQHPQGARLEREMPIHVSNVQPLDGAGNPTRVGRRFDEGQGQWVRVATTTGDDLA